MTLKRHLIYLLLITTLISFVTQAFYFVFIFNDRIEDARDTSFSVLRQTDVLLNQSLSQVKHVAKSVSDSEDFQNYLLYKNGGSGESLSVQVGRMGYLKNFLRGLVTSNDAIYDIILADLKDGILSYSMRFNYTNYKYLQETYSLYGLTSPVYISEPRTTSGTSSPVSALAYVLPVRHTTGMFSERNNLLGYCIILVSQGALQSIVDNTSIGNSYTAIVNASGSAIVENMSSVLDASAFPPVEMLIQNTEALSQDEIAPILYENIRYYTNIRKSSETGWYTINLFPESVLYENVGTLIPLALLLALVNLIAIVIIAGGMLRSIYRQIKSIIASLKCVSETSGKHRLPGSPHKEFDQISTAVNNMLDSLDQANSQILAMQNRLYETELLQKQSDLKALQSQINPHFLFNTLECIRSIASLRGAAEITDLASCMAGIFRYSISGGIESTVKAECDCVKDYFTILSIRHPDRFSMNMQINENLYPLKIVKMSLQPLMENTVKHALEATEDALSIELKGWTEGDKLYLTFSDDGSGMPEERLKEVRRKLTENTSSSQDDKSTGIGLTNINQRIRLYYGPDYGLDITSAPGKGTTVTLTLPLLNNNASSSNAQ